MSVSPSVQDTARQILDVLRQRQLAAAFIPEVEAALGPTDSMETALKAMCEAGLVWILSEPAPDPHLEHFDLRVVALIEDGDQSFAQAAAREIWGGWVRQFLANHRCQ